MELMKGVYYRSDRWIHSLRQSALTKYLDLTYSEFRPAVGTGLA